MRACRAEPEIKNELFPGGFEMMPQHCPEVSNLLLFPFFNAFSHLPALCTWPGYNVLNKVELRHLGQDTSERGKKGKNQLLV